MARSAQNSKISTKTHRDLVRMLAQNVCHVSLPVACNKHGNIIGLITTKTAVMQLAPSYSITLSQGLLSTWYCRYQHMHVINNTAIQRYTPGHTGINEVLQRGFDYVLSPQSEVSTPVV